MNMISGIYYPDEGSICIGGQGSTDKLPEGCLPVPHRHDPSALQVGGRVYGGGEHRAGCTGNGTVFHGCGEPAGQGNHRAVWLPSGADQEDIRDVGLEKQTVEIVKVLYRGVDIPIPDEPTAVPTPQEAGRLFDILRVMRAEGKAIIIITHKLHEVMAISDRVAVLRRVSILPRLRRRIPPRRS